MSVRARSGVTNGKRLFMDKVDGRTSWARRMRDLLSLHASDLGGVETISAAEHSICRRVATITTELEILEQRFALANGASAVDIDLYIRIANSLRRMLESVGIQRRSKDITPPTLIDIAREIDDANAEAQRAAAINEVDEGVA